MVEKSRADEALTQASVTSPETSVSGSDEKAVYEVGFHLVPTLGEDEVKDFAERIKSSIEKAGAEILAHEAPKRMTLSYRIERSVAGKREKYTESYFGFFKFEIDIAEIQALEQSLRGDKHILRYLLIETIREQAPVPRLMYSSDRLEGETIRKPVATTEEPAGEVSEEELDKSIEALVNE